MPLSTYKLTQSVNMGTCLRPTCPSVRSMYRSPPAFLFLLINTPTPYNPLNPRSVDGTFFVTQAVANQMATQSPKGGSIVVRSPPASPSSYPPFSSLPRSSLAEQLIPISLRYFPGHLEHLRSRRRRRADRLHADKGRHQESDGELRGRSRSSLDSV
jgi:hypothetical protein